MGREVFGRVGKETFSSSSRLGIDEAHYGPSAIDCAFFSLGLVMGGTYRGLHYVCGFFFLCIYLYTSIY